MTRDEHERRARGRFRDTAGQRRQVSLALQGGMTPFEIDSPERAARHLRYLGVEDRTSADVVQEAMAERRRGRTPSLERIIGRDNLLSVLFLTKGAQCSRAVGAIGARDDFFGTGFLVGPGLLLTNNHVLPDAGEAAECCVAFNYEDTLQGRIGPEYRFDLRPQDLFLTSEDLDYTLIAVAAEAGDARLADFGCLSLNPNTGKVLLGEPLNVIQHPGGGRKQVALRENRFTALLDDFMHYETDTNPGSSGSPVFNDMWDVVALHHSVVPERDDGGQWVGNEGVRISVIVEDLWRRADEAARALLAGAIPPPPEAPSRRTRARSDEVRYPEPRRGSAQRRTFEIDVPSASGRAVRVPVVLTIEVAPEMEVEPSERQLSRGWPFPPPPTSSDENDRPSLQFSSRLRSGRPAGRHTL